MLLNGSVAFDESILDYATSEGIMQALGLEMEFPLSLMPFFSAYKFGDSRITVSLLG